MNKLARAAVIGVILVAGGVSAAMAHHSAAKFDFSKNIWIGGTVKDIRVINPHMSLTLVAQDDKGTQRDVVFEGHSVNNFYRDGWRTGMIVAGDKIKVRFNPRKDGTDGGFVNGFVTAQGKEVAFHMPGDALPPPPSDSGAATPK